jgi:Iap family predicted aminopeptidase
MLGCSGPGWLVSEGIVLRVHSDPGLRALAARVAADNPTLGAYPCKLDGGMTEMADALAAGIPAITIIGLTPDGKAPYWHLPTDTEDKMDPAAMERNYSFARAVIDALDG